MRRRGLLAGLLLTGGALAGCRRVPSDGTVQPPGAPQAPRGSVAVRDYDGIPFLGTGTLNARADQIKRAAVSQGWVVEDRGARMLRATYNQRSYQAVVDIPYNAQNFSIRYVSSQNLETAPGFILPTYNDWVERLQRAIVTGR